MSDKKSQVCPWWLGYVLVSPLRRLWENPRRILGPWIRKGMTVLEPGSGMGYFTLEAARLVGASGTVIAVDLQEKMIGGLKRRLRRAGLLDRVDARVASPGSLGIEDLVGTVDLVLAVHFVHEVPDRSRLFLQLASALKLGGRVLFIEPKGHVSKANFQESLQAASAAGLAVEKGDAVPGKRSALLLKTR